MALRTNPAPYQRTKNSTLRIMLILTAALLVVWAFAILYSYKLDGTINSFVAEFNEKNASKISKGKAEALVNPNYGIRSILIVVFSVLTTAVVDLVTALISHKKGGNLKEEIVNKLVHNYSYVTAIIFALTLPVYIPYYVVIVGAVFATAICKNVFGGFGKNIFNPAIMARIFVGICFISMFEVPQILKDVACGIDGVSGATLTTAFNNQTGWLSTSLVDGISTVKGTFISGYSLMDIMLGRYVGALGETFTLVILALGVVLSLLKVINWRTPVFYLGTVALTTLVIALVCGFSNPLQYVLYHLSLGGLMFGAIFMITDPVTGPTSSFGKCLIGAVAGLMTVLIRVKGGYPEGVMYSIALCNLVSPAIDYFTVGKSNDHLIKKSCILGGTILVAIALCTGISFKQNGGREVYAINGMDVAEYNYLETYMTLNEGDSFAKADGYTVKTENVKGFVVSKAQKDSSGNVIKEESKLDAVYYINNSNGDKVATVYSVNDSEPVSYGEGYLTVNSTILVAISNDGTIYGIGLLQPINTANYGLESSINEFVMANYVGINNEAAQAVEKIAGASYSSEFIKKLIAAAYAEYNA